MGLPGLSRSYEVKVTQAARRAGALPGMLPFIASKFFFAARNPPGLGILERGRAAPERRRLRAT